MKKHFLYLLALALIVIAGCQKELSFEIGNAPGSGSLQADVTGDCLPKTVNGSYSATIPLIPTANTIVIQVNVTRTGTYVITTDTVNGYYFRATGTFTTLGNTNVTLRGNGTPFASGTDNFVVSYNGTICDIQILVIAPGVGTLAGAPTACAPITVNGTYSPGVALTASNNAVIQVNVTTPGAFNITTDTVAGIWFNFSGSLLGGAQSVTLLAHGSIAGTPVGPQTFKVKLGASQCTFVVTVAAPAAGTVNCAGAVFAGTFTAGVALTAANTVQISVTVVTAGAYSITTDTVNGVWFNTSGVFPTGTTTVPLTLTGHGTPTNPGPFTYTVKWGTSTCTFSCTFAPPLSTDYFPRTTNSNWSYEFDDNIDPTDTLLRQVIPATLSAAGNTYNIFMPDEGAGLDSTGNYSAGYYRKTGGDYFERFEYGAFFTYDNPGWAEYIMLKDNVAAGTNWKTPPTGMPGTVAGNPFNLRFSYTILQKDVPITMVSSLGSVTYQNVIVVEEKIEFEVTPGVWQDATTALDYFGKSYYARGIGLIKFEAFTAAGASQYLQELRRYNVF